MKGAESFRTSVKQREALTLLRRDFAERGFLIFPAPKWCKHHALDFVAIPKEWPQQLVLVRPLTKGGISVRPYSSPSAYESVRKFLRERAKRYPVQVRWNGRQLPYVAAGRDWSSYVPRAHRDEIRMMLS